MFTHADIPPTLRAHLPPGAALAFPLQGMTSDVAFAGERHVVKRCRDPRYLDWLEREHRVLRALEHSDVPAPRLVEYGELMTASGGERWLLMTRVPGRSLRDELLNAGARKRTDLFRRAGELLRRLHATPVPRELQRRRPWIDERLAKAEGNLAWCDGTSELLADLRHRRPAAVPDMFIHGDFAPDNVLVDAGAGMSLIDWSDGGAGDPRHDLAIILRADRSLGADEVDAFFDGYGSSDDRLTRAWFEHLDEFF